MIPDIDTARLILGLIWHQLWIGTAIVACAALCLRICGRWNAATRHWIWAFVMLGVALLPLSALMPEPALESSLEAASPTDRRISDVTAPTGSPAAERSAPVTGADVDRATITRLAGAAALIVWSTGSLWMLLRLAGGIRLARRLRRNSAPVAMRSVPAEVRRSRLARSPMVVGLWRPCILVPGVLLDRATPAEVRRILDHELAHVRRRDHWIMLVQRLIEALYFFHPGIRFAAAHLEEEREMSCDDRAAANQRETYAGSLLGVCRTLFASRSPAPLAVGIMRSRGQLRRRIAHLLDGERNHAPNVSTARLALGAVVLMAGVALGAQAMPRLAIASDTIALARDAEQSISPFGPSLIECAARGDTNCLQALIDAGANVDGAVPGDGTPLIVAARAGRIETVEWLLDHGAGVDGASRGDGNPLIMAAARDRSNIVRLLLDRGADIDAVVPGDENALISAARSGAVEAVRLLLERGADVNIAVEVTNFRGEHETRTALNQSRARGHDEIAELLVEHGAAD